MVVTYIGKGKGEIAHVDKGSAHSAVLAARGWAPLDELDAKRIRDLSPVKLPPRAKNETLARLASAAMMAGESEEPQPEAPKPKGQAEKETEGILEGR